MRPTAIAMPSLFADDAPDVSWVIDHSDNAVVVCDEAARITWINQGFTRMLGYTLEEAAGRRPSDFLAGPHTDPETVEWVRGQLTATSVTCWASTPTSPTASCTKSCTARCWARSSANSRCRT